MINSIVIIVLHFYFKKRKLRKESLKLAAQQRYRDQQALHRRRQQLRHSSKSLSDERFSTSSSVEMMDPHGHPQYLQQQQYSKQPEGCNNLHYNKHLDSRYEEFNRPTKPTYLELKQINIPSNLPLSAAAQQVHQPPTSTTSRRTYGQEQHPVASARIYAKPKLRREFSIAYETGDNQGVDEDPNVSHRTLSSSQTAGKQSPSNFVNII